MGTDRPGYRAPLSVRRAISCGPAAPGWYGALPPLPGSLAKLSATLTARAFAACAEGDWETCDGLLAEARGAAGAIFTAFAEHLVSPAFPYRADHPAWDAFLDRVAVMVLGPGSRAPRPPDPMPPAEPVGLAAELRAMGLT